MHSCWPLLPLVTLQNRGNYDYDYDDDCHNDDDNNDYVLARVFFVSFSKVSLLQRSFVAISVFCQNSYRADCLTVLYTVEPNKILVVIEFKQLRFGAIFSTTHRKHLRIVSSRSDLNGTYAYGILMDFYCLGEFAVLGIKPSAITTRRPSERQHPFWGHIFIGILYCEGY